MSAINYTVSYFYFLFISIPVTDFEAWYDISTAATNGEAIDSHP